MRIQEGSAACPYTCFSGTGKVSGAANIIDLNDSLTARLYAPNSGDSAQVEGDFGAHYGGTVVIDWYSQSGYTSQVQVEVSSTGAAGSWTVIYHQYLTPSSNNTPVWINLNDPIFGPVFNIDYSMVTVSYNGMPANVFIDTIYLE